MSFFAAVGMVSWDNTYCDKNNKIRIERNLLIRNKSRLFVGTANYFNQKGSQFGQNQRLIRISFYTGT